jgi:hypothetical protein
MIAAFVIPLPRHLTLEHLEHFRYDIVYKSPDSWEFFGRRALRELRDHRCAMHTLLSTSSAKVHESVYEFTIARRCPFNVLEKLIGEAIGDNFCVPFLRCGKMGGRCFAQRDGGDHCTVANAREGERESRTELKSSAIKGVWGDIWKEGFKRLDGTERTDVHFARLSP